MHSRLSEMLEKSFWCHQKSSHLSAAGLFRKQARDYGSNAPKHFEGLGRNSHIENHFCKGLSTRVARLKPESIKMGMQ